MASNSLLRRALFKITLDHIEAAYRLASKAHVDIPNEIEKTGRRTIGIGPDDPWPDRNDEDPYDHVGRAYDDMEAASTEAWYGSAIVRKAFLISLFHAWERFINAERGVEDYVHPEEWLISRGHQECARPILELQKAANCAKHGPGNSCKALFRMRPDLFPGVTDANKASDARLEIGDELLTHFFEVVRKAAS
ncbi:hypothetical protein [Aquamicrobium soli]|uniref:Uncharacterized protein n=1 Tax=Aquamicrobium soli TaxID=1811518 RepID=A0ABV7K6X6_9HYPH